MASGGVVIPNPSKYNSLEDVINTVSGLVRIVIVLALVIALMYGGWVRLSSQGNEDKVAQSSKIITSALIGFAIIVLAPVIVDFFGKFIGAQGNLLDLGK